MNNKAFAILVFFALVFLKSASLIYSSIINKDSEIEKTKFTTQVEDKVSTLLNTQINHGEANGSGGFRNNQGLDDDGSNNSDYENSETWTYYFFYYDGKNHLSPGIVAMIVLIILQVINFAVLIIMCCKKDFLQPNDTIWLVFVLVLVPLLPWLVILIVKGCCPNSFKMKFQNEEHATLVKNEVLRGQELRQIDNNYNVVPNNANAVVIEDNRATKVSSNNDLLSNNNRYGKDKGNDNIIRINSNYSDQSSPDFFKKV